MSLIRQQNNILWCKVLITNRKLNKHMAYRTMILSGSLIVE